MSRELGRCALLTADPDVWDAVAGPVAGYYSGVGSLWTTRCCRSLRLRWNVLSGRLSPFVLACVSVGPLAHAQPSVPPSIFPLQPSWRATLDGPPAQLPAADRTHLYLPLRQGQLIAVAVGDGLMQWSIDQPVTVPPVVGGATLFVAAGRELHALDTDTGLPEWRLTFETEVSAPLLWDADWLIVGLANGDVLAYQGLDGRPAWRQRLSVPMRIAATIAGDRLYLPLEDGRVMALDLLTGEPLWERQFDGTPAPILAFDDRLFLGTTDNFFYCVSSVTGTIHWRWRTGADIIGAPVVDTERVYFVSLDNQIRALDRRTGVQRWKRNLPTRPVAGLRQMGHLLVQTGRAPSLRLYYAGDGQPAGELEIASELAVPPIVFSTLDDATLTVVLVTDQGEVQAFRTADGPRMTAMDYLPGFIPIQLVVSLLPLDYMPGWLSGTLADVVVPLHYLPGLPESGPTLVALDDLPGRTFPPPLTRLLYVPGLPDAAPPLAPLDVVPGRHLGLVGRRLSVPPPLPVVIPDVP